MLPRELPGIRKTAGQPEKQTCLFFGLSGGFSLCACAQQGQLRWPARKRWTALLFQFDIVAFTMTNVLFCFSFGSKEKRIPFPLNLFAAFTTTNGVSLLLSLTQREKIPVSYPLPVQFPFVHPFTAKPPRGLLGRRSAGAVLMVLMVACLGSALRHDRSSASSGPSAPPRPFPAGSRLSGPSTGRCSACRPSWAPPS